MSRFVLTAQLQLQAPTNTAQVVRQIQSQLNNVQVNVQVQGTAQATRQVQQVAQSLNAANSAASNLGRTFAISVKRFTALAVATRAVSLFTNTLASATEEAISFERQLIKISQVTGQSIGELKGLTKTITQLSTGLGVGSQSLLEVSTILLQAGLNSRDTEVALKSLAKAALAPNFDSISETAEGAIAVLAQFKEGVGALENQLSSIDAVAGAFAVEAGDLIDVIRRTGGVFKASGGSLNELLALFTSVRATTRESAESIATGLRTIFTRIQRPKTIEFLKQFGVELVDLEGKFVGPFEAIKRLSESLAGLGERDLTFISIAEELGGFRQIGKVLPLLQQFSTAQAALNVAQKANNGLTKNAETAQLALAIRITKVKEEFLALVRGITETSAFQFFANTTLNLASALIRLADALKPVIPLLTAVATIRAAQGISSFITGFGGGLGSRRTFNKGGKVHHFARGGMVPGTGNRDTVPAMLQPGEFVIRKSSVGKLGAGNLAAMNNNKYAIGGKVGGIALAPVDGRQSGQGSVSINDIATSLIKNTNLPGGISGNQRVFQGVDSSKNAKNVIQRVGGFSNPSPSSSRSFSAVGYGFPSAKAEAQIQDNLNNSLSDLISGAAKELGASVGVQSSSLVPSQIIKSIGTADILGKVFEGSLNLLGAPFDNLQAKQDRDAFDFPSGLGAQLGSYFTELGSIPTDAKKTLDKKILDDIATRKVKNLIAGQVNTDPEFIKLKQQKIESSKTNKAKKAFFGGIIQKFAKGGIAQPLVDDILSNASNAILPTPQSAIQKLIKAGGGFVDIDRTLKRTVGDQAYARARTEKEKQAVLSKYFANSQNRLNDIKTAGLTQFGTELQNSIKSGQLNGSNIRVISKSLNTPGVSEYLSGIFGIPSRNFAFTGGKSKVPLMRRFATGGGVGTDTVPALLTPGEFVVNKKSAQAIGYGSLNRMNKVGRYAKGGPVQRFAAGGKTYAETNTFSAGGLFSQIAAERDKIEKENLQRISKVYTQAYNDIKKIHEEQVADAQAAGKSIDEIKAIFDKSNKAIKSLKEDTTGQAQLVKQSAQSEAKQKALQSRQNNPDLLFAQAKAQASRGESLSASTDFGRKAFQQLTTEQLKHIKALQQSTAASQRAASADAQEAAQSTNAARADAAEAASSSRTSSMFGGLGGGMTLVTASLQSLLPPLEENSGLFIKASHSLLTMLTMLGSVVFALEAFGISLNKQTIASGLSMAGSALTGGLGKTSAAAGAAAGSATFGALGAGAGGGMFGAASVSTAVAGVTSALTAVAIPLLAAAATFYVLKSGLDLLVDSIYDYSGRLKKTIEAGDIEKARSIATSQQDTKNLTTIFSGGVAGAVAGAIIGTAIAPGIGTAVGAVIGSSLGSFTALLLGSDWPQYTGQLAASQASQVATTKALTKATEDSTKAMQEFEGGTASALDVLRSTIAATAAAAQQRAEAEKLAKSAEENKSNVGGNTLAGFAGGAVAGAAIGSIVPIIGTAVGAAVGGVIGGSVAAVQSNRRNARIDASVEGARKEATKAEEDALKAAAPGLQVLQRQVAATGGSFNDFLDIIKATDPNLFNIIIKQGTTDLSKSFTNLAKEAERTRKAFDAMSLGFQKVSAVSGALGVGLENYLAKQEAGNIGLESTIRTLEASVTSAAQGISDTDFKAALGDASSGLRKLGASDTQVKKFEENLTAINTAQKFYAQASEEVKNRLVEQFKRGAGADLSAVGKRETFANVIAGQLEGAGIGEETRKRISDAIKGADISDTDLNKILEGDLSALDKVLKDLGETTLNQVIGPLQELAKYQKALVDITKKRLELENNLISAQRGVLEAQLEAQEIMSKYGGPALTPAMRSANAIQQANVQAQGLGVGNLNAGTGAELNARSGQTRARLAQIGGIRVAAAAGNAAAQSQLEGESGTKLAAEEKRLLDLAKSDYETTKELIKNKEAELQLIKEKNSLEKSSVDALVSGDITKFFEQQAAVGAQAAIALGSDRLQGAFGASALGAAAQETRRQQEAGVQELYGQRLSGPGGLTERAFGSAIGAMGVTDVRLAQVAAGTTAEETALQAQIVDLASTLPNFAQAQLESSGMEVMAAQQQYQAAQMQLEAAKQNVNDRAGGAEVQNRARGGLIYANRGIFVPRGTDTVPAMLTPGEFVVRREAVQRGNNLQLLQAMNRGNSNGDSSINGSVGMANGGMVRYRSNGSSGPESGGGGFGISPEVINNLVTSLTQFNKDLSSNIEKLNSTNFNVKLDTTNINVNLTGTSFLGKLTEDLQSKLYTFVGQEIQNYSVSEGGKLKRNTSTLTN